ncbi:MAG: hypothetical protein HZB86_06265 [Deltaproteobacteria bacterium]|nr:hypothetical protein [Deltaproteobacteria bacterium]
MRIIRVLGKFLAAPRGHVFREDHPPEFLLPVGGGSFRARVDDPPREDLLVVVRIGRDSPHALGLQDPLQILSLVSQADPLEGEEEGEEILRRHVGGDVEGGDLVQEELGGEAADEAVAVPEEHVPVEDLVLGDAEQQVAGRLRAHDLGEVPVEFLDAPGEGRVPRLVQGDPVEHQRHLDGETFDPADIGPLRRALHGLPGTSKIRNIVSDGKGGMISNKIASDRRPYGNGGNLPGERRT